MTDKIEHIIRPVQTHDVPGLKEVIDSTELFPSEFLDQMIANYFSNETSEDIWFTCVQDGNPIAMGYCAPEKLTNGTYNLYVIAVRKEWQNHGIGKRMMNYIESFLKERGKRILLVETSSLDQYTSTRAFYDKIGYRREAVIKDFWNEGEDKLIFLKKL